MHRSYILIMQVNYTKTYIHNKPSYPKDSTPKFVVFLILIINLQTPLINLVVESFQALNVKSVKSMGMLLHFFIFIIHNLIIVA